MVRLAEGLGLLAGKMAPGILLVVVAAGTSVVETLVLLMGFLGHLTFFFGAK